MVTDGKMITAGGHAVCHSSSPAFFPVSFQSIMNRLADDKQYKI